jgi:hypothetical protein
VDSTSLALAIHASSFSGSLTVRNTVFMNNSFVTIGSRRLLAEQAAAYDEALYERVSRLLKGGYTWNQALHCTQ